MFEDEETRINPDNPGFYDGEELLGVGRREEPQIDQDQEEVKTKLEQFEKLKAHLGEDGIQGLLEDADYEQAELEKKLKEDPEYANRLRALVTKVDMGQLRTLDEENLEKAMGIINKEYPHLKDNLLEVKAFWERANRINPRATFDENVRIACNNATTYLGLGDQVAKKRHSEWISDHQHRLWMIRQGGRQALKEEREGKK